jgi:hypothetical protein
MIENILLKSSDENMARFAVVRWSKISFGRQVQGSKNARMATYHFQIGTVVGCYTDETVENHGIDIKEQKMALQWYVR